MVVQKEVKKKEVKHTKQEEKEDIDFSTVTPFSR
jgi:hypothetical protein